MRSCRRTSGESLRLPDLSRRAVLAGTSVTAFDAAKPVGRRAKIAFAPTLAASDEGARRCATWLAIDAEIARLQARWSSLESWLAHTHDWFNLIPAEQQTLPGAKELRDIDDCLDVLFKERAALLATVPDSGAVSVKSLLARLAVVERLIWGDEHPEAHALIVECRQDLAVLFGAHAAPI